MEDEKPVVSDGLLTWCFAMMYGVTMGVTLTLFVQWFW
jgi:hypothetical protein